MDALYCEPETKLWPTDPVALTRKIAFVLGGGGARGALQVGALQALLDTRVFPQHLIGTSVGAINAAYIAVKGFSQSTLQSLMEVWESTVCKDFLPSNPVKLFFENLLPQHITTSFSVLRELFIDGGLEPSLRFKDITGVELTLVTTDLLTGKPYLFGNSIPDRSEESVLDAVLASACLPPWMFPRVKNGRYLMDGGVVSGLPIEPAISLGATDIFALDLSPQTARTLTCPSLKTLINRVIFTSMDREKKLEILLAKARGVNLKLIPLSAKNDVSISNFHDTRTLINEGYDTTRLYLQDWQKTEDGSHE